ncbi:hypothetical protein Glove_300g33 [Diversispora epigaea]|uniref:BTB domain-containing protein n=1 Tax=Diversispora epigaea TaxID=1348612 RepID=A0A397I2Z9_9GLOM|nr:hypothetical protein Glove_300g33 [Diversispora epigaea]
MSFKFFDKLFQDFSELLYNKKEHNIVIKVDKEENKKSFTAHSVVLRYRSFYFNKELENATMNKNHIKTIIKQNFSTHIFEIILKYIYENYLIESKASWLRTHFFIVYHSIFSSNEFKGLKKFYNDIIVKHPNLIFEFEDFTSLQKTVFVSILQRNDLKVEEALKTTLQKCLPLIRYFHIPGEDIWEKVKPYEKILEKQLWDDIIQCHMFPNKPVKSFVFPARNTLNPKLASRIISILEFTFSTIINREHAAELLLWINQKSTTYFLESIPYEFQLIFLGSRDGFRPKTFWNMCHGYADTIVVAKVNGTDEIVESIPYEFQLIFLGSRDGFRPKTFWNMCHGYADTIVVAKVNGTDEIVGSTDNQNTYGPFFGYCEFMMKSDVSNFIQDKQCWCQYNVDNYYEKPIRTTNEFFSIIDYVVFKIIKKQVPNCTIR